MTRSHFTLNEDLQLALQLADAADEISRARFLAMDLEVSTKPDKTPVTDADRAVEQAIIDILSRERGEDFMLGEEFGEQAGSVSEHPTGTSDHPHRQWIIDPIDGTSNFLRGVPVWATLISLAIDGVPVIGVVSAPALGKRWWGSKGNGAWVDESHDPLANVPIPEELSEYLEQPMVAVAAPRKLEVSGVKDLADASISYNSLQQWDQAGYLDELVGLSRKVWRTRAYGDMWSYMMVAEGILDVAGEFDLKPYDMAALMPIVTEAGGTFTSIDGHADVWHGSALATNGQLHAAVLAELAR
ncbi:histidinol-phosphatase [Aurantimicrobium minutum]|uniref:inositol monophosphatase family protein n=1 Tax=Aurantimicrobium minutum TaxID=708131 RepID=UPI002406504D|nr:inositol monophosphatase family protein [Aurantimicrobium minutum]MDF9809123.1 histidinol-phosphatase [Aurantimicrobium minutum]